MSLLIPDGEVEPTTAGVSRRRILQGVAWGTPAVIIATAAPAAAASGPVDPKTVPPVQLPSGTGMESHGLVASYVNKYWNETVGGNVSVSKLGFNVQNKGNSAPLTSSIIVTVVVPVGNMPNPTWGIGNQNGIAPGQPWTLASGPTVANNKATITLVYTGAPLAPWGGVNISNLWVEARGNQKNNVATVVVNATYQGNATSIHTANVTLTD